MKRFGISLLFALIATSVASAAEPTVAFEVTRPEDVALDSAKLAEIGDYMEREVEEGRIVGCMALVARGDQVAYLDLWGKRNREKSEAMTADTIFRIYSMSKPITSVAAMQLVESGKMDLDDAVSQYLPAFENLKVLVREDGESKEVPLDRPITVRDLMRHTSGLTYGFFGNSEVDKAYRKAGILMTDINIDQTVKKLAKLPLMHQPGRRWHYSVSTDVLGRLVEAVSEQRFDEYLQEHIFEPLDMTDTFFMVPAEKQNRFAEMYARDGDNGLKLASPLSSYRFLNPSNKYFSGGGGLCSTTRDYLRFCRALLKNGELDGKRIIKQDSLAEMTKNQLDSGSFRFGLGFAISPEGEYSWGGAAGTRFWINPKRQLIVIYMIQINPYSGEDYGRRIKDIAYAADQSRSVEPEAATAPMP